MVSVIFRAKAKQGKEDEAAQRFTQMVEAVQANEPDVLAYVLHRAQEDPSEIVFYELYTDDAAFQAHMGTPHMNAMRAAFGELCDTTQVKVERLQHVAGFTRS
jgi:quinol monooxygenase YgiN